MKPDDICYAAAVGLGLAVMSGVPAWSQNLIGGGIGVGQDPYASSYRPHRAEGVDRSAAAHHNDGRQRHF